MRKRLNFQEGWLILGLVLALAITPAAAMRWADWVPGLWVLQATSLLAVASGFLLAKSRFSGRVAFLISLVYGVFTVGFFSGLMLPEAMSWNAKIPELVTRQLHWLQKAANVILDPDAADISRDGLIFVMQTGMLLWLVGHLAAWYTFRKLRIWLVIVPSGIVLLLTVTNYYGPEPMMVTVVGYLFFTILYIVSSHYMVRERNWREQKVVYNRETRLDFLQIGFLIALVAIPLAWLVPNAAAGGVLQEYSEPLDSGWQRIQDGWTQLFASLKSYGGEYADLYGKTLALGGPRDISPEPVMDVQANGGRYWRGTSYDKFTGAGWTTTVDKTLVVDPDRQLEVSSYARQQVITVTITTYLPNTGMIYFPHRPQGTDRQVKMTVLEDGSDSYDIIDAVSRYVLYEGKKYDAWGTASVADDVSLRAAGDDYPDWVVGLYLQLPPDLSPRIAELADEIAGNRLTPYDKAEALTDWLRTNITYNEHISAPPVDVDPLEYFLYNSREGYCNYYASALVVMLRTQGIPARIVAGYAQGTYLEDQGVYRVYSDDSHTWVEVFFPHYGWVEFEPTASEAPIVRTAAKNEIPPPGGTTGDQDDPLEELLDEDQMMRDRALSRGETGGGASALPGKIGWVAGGVAAVLVLAGGALAFWAQSWVAGETFTSQVYDRMNRFARWLGVQLLPSQTPHERAAVLVTAAPDARPPIEVITDLYVEERFGQVENGRFDEQAARAWRELWPALAKRGALNRFSRLQRPRRTKPPLEV
jgi:transglutaminase-like putative cysteine protease